MQELLNLLFDNVDKKEVRNIINNMHEKATLELAKDLSIGEEKYNSDIAIVSLSTQINEEYSFTLLKAMALDMYRNDTQKRTIINEFIDSLQELYNQHEEIIKRC